MSRDHLQNLPTWSAFRAELERIIAGTPAAVDTPASDLDGATEMPEAEQPDEPASPGSVGAPIYKPTILDLPACERPRERLREHGPRYLNNAELVAILLRSGVAGGKRD